MYYKENVYNLNASFKIIHIMQKHLDNETLHGSLIRVLKVKGNTIYITIKLRVLYTSRYFIRCQENTC